MEKKLSIKNRYNHGLTGSLIFLLENRKDNLIVKDNFNCFLSKIIKIKYNLSEYIMTQKAIKNGVMKVIDKQIEVKINTCKPLIDIDLFNFIEIKTLRNAIKKSYKEALFIKNITSKLSINNEVAHPFNEIVILHYASIYEAILDHTLDKYFKKDIKDLLRTTTLKKKDISQILIKDALDETNLYLCKEKIEYKKKLHTVKFEDRVNKAIKIGIIDLSIVEEIKALYTLRNNIHILKASTNGTKFTKQIVVDYCKDDLLRSFCENIKNQIQSNTNE